MRQQLAVTIKQLETYNFQLLMHILNIPGWALAIQLVVILVSILTLTARSLLILRLLRLVCVQLNRFLLFKNKMPLFASSPTRET